MTKYMTEFVDDGTPRENPKKFEVIKYPAEGGFRYVIYFPTEQAAAQAITDFWNNRMQSTFAPNALKSGMFVPIKHPTYTEGDRTHSFLLTSEKRVRSASIREWRTRLNLMETKER
jgi:hypothetical protein